MPVLHDICDPSAIYPCSAGQECKETAAGLEPTCNCKQGYYEDFDYCMMGMLNLYFNLRQYLKAFIALYSIKPVFCSVMFFLF